MNAWYSIKPDLACTMVNIATIRPYMVTQSMPYMVTQSMPYMVTQSLQTLNDYSYMFTNEGIFEVWEKEMRSGQVSFLFQSLQYTLSSSILGNLHVTKPIYMSMMKNLKCALVGFYVRSCDRYKGI